MTDYTELELYLEEDKTVDLWVYTDPGKFFIVKDVNNNPTRLNGWWTISFTQYNHNASAHIEDARLMYFVTVDKDRVDDN
jgi:hypothetical protein